MKPQMLVLALIMAAVAACGASVDSKIVLKDSDNGVTRTHAEVRDMISSGEIDLMGEDCATFTSVGSKANDVTFPAGQAAFIAACEEGQKEKEPSGGS